MDVDALDGTVRLVTAEAKEIVHAVANGWSAASDPSYPNGLLLFADLVAECGSQSILERIGQPGVEDAQPELKEAIYHEIFCFLRTLGYLV